MFIIFEMGFDIKNSFVRLCEKKSFYLQENAINFVKNVKITHNIRLYIGKNDINFKRY